METLQVPTHIIDVELRIGRGESIRGRMFASELPGHHTSTELLLELLNDEREFVPFDADEPARGRVSLNKQHIVAAHPTIPANEIAAEPDAPDPSDSEETCWVLMSDGQQLTGHLRVPTPWSASRVLDKLNQAPRFVPLVTADGMSIVHSSHIVRVW